MQHKTATSWRHKKQIYFRFDFFMELRWHHPVMMILSSSTKEESIISIQSIPSPTCIGLRGLIPTEYSYFLALGTKRMDCRYRLTGDVSILLGIDLFWSRYRVPMPSPTDSSVTNSQNVCLCKFVLFPIWMVLMQNICRRVFVWKDLKTGSCHFLDWLETRI